MEMSAMTDRPADAGIPRVLAIAWGRAEPSTRGPKAGLSAAAIVAAAIELADAEGLAAVSMSRVAERLGYTPMSLYRHVPSKEALLALVQDAVFGDPPEADLTDVDWRDGLAAWARDMCAAYLAHPWVLDIPISGPPAMPHQLAWLERALTVTAPTPLSLAEQLSVALLVSGYARTWAQLARDLRRGREHSGLTDDQVFPEYQRVLVEVVDPGRLPAVHAVFTEGLLEDGSVAEPESAAGDDDEEFEFGLQRILDGVAAYMAGRA
jgi:AcrR family transcriptional regulator